MTAPRPPLPSRRAASRRKLTTSTKNVLCLVFNMGAAAFADAAGIDGLERQRIFLQNVRFGARRSAEVEQALTQLQKVEQKGK